MFFILVYNTINLISKHLVSSIAPGRTTQVEEGDDRNSELQLQDCTD